VSVSVVGAEEEIEAVVAATALSEFGEEMFLTRWSRDKLRVSEASGRHGRRRMVPK
jgi:hypothetical protein